MLSVREKNSSQNTQKGTEKTSADFLVICEKSINVAGPKSHTPIKSSVSKNNLIPLQPFFNLCHQHSKSNNIRFFC